MNIAQCDDSLDAMDLLMRLEQAAVHESRPIDDNDDGFRQQPATVFALRRKRAPVCEESGRVLLIKSLSRNVHPFIRGRKQRLVSAKPAVTLLHRLLACERRIFTA